MAGISDLDASLEAVILLGGLSDTDSERRKKAEDTYNAIPAKDRLSFLGTTLCESQMPLDVRIFAAILLRRLILASWTDIQNSIPAQQLMLSCNQLLQVLRNSINEMIEPLTDKICQVIAVLGKCFVNEEVQVNQWNEFVQLLFDLLKSPDSRLRKAGLNIFSAEPKALGQINGQTAYIEQLVPCLMENLVVPVKPHDFLYPLASGCTALIVSNAANKECVKKLSTMALPLLETFKSAKDESVKDQICQLLIEVAEEAPLSLRPAITQIMQTCLAIMNDEAEDADLKFSVLELVVSLIENAPVMVKKRASSFIKPIVLKVLQFMSSIEDDPKWFTSCTNEKDEDEPDAIGESALDRISNALGGKVLLPILMDELTEMLRRPEWQARHAALMAFSCAGEGCRDQLMKVLDRVVSGILTFLADPHPRVRHAACNAIGQMATDFNPEFESKFHSQIIPALCRLLVDFSNIRVQAHSACAMINFFEECPQDILSNYLNPITDHIEIALSTYMSEGVPKDEGKLFVVENIIVALSSVADSSAESFTKYYEKFMPCLKFIIKDTQGKDDLRVLRGKAIECVSLIGMAVGREKFIADASDIMQMLLATQIGEIKLSDDDPQLSYMMAAWARICRILGADFQSYLPYVMEPVLRAAALKVEIALLNDEDKAQIENSSEWESVSVEDQAVGIRTAGLEDKATACSMLVCYARELKHGFVDYVERTAEVLVPLLKFPFHDDVRCAAAEAMPYLLESAKPKGDQCVQALWNAIFENILNASDVEYESSVYNQLMESLGSCIETVGVSSMTADKFDKLSAKLNEKFNAHFKYLIEEFKRRKDEDYETDSECSEDDQDCLAGIASVIHSLFIVYKADYLRYFQALVEPVLKLSDQQLPWPNKQTALCIWDDVIEYTGVSSIDYSKFFLPLLSSGVLDKNKEVRQAALYGVGQLAQQTGVNFRDFFHGLVPSIMQIINHAEAREEDYIMATENGISAIGKILKYCPQLPNHDELLRCWVEWLPIWEDDTEVPFVMEFLLQLIEQNNPTVMGSNSSNLPRLVAIVAEVFARSAIDTESQIGLKLVSFLKQVHANPSVNYCMNNLTENQQKAVQEVMSS